MQVIVPLAGPDYFSSKVAKGLERSIFGEFQLKHILETRPWSKENKLKYSFILHDSNESRSFAKNYLSNWFDNTSYVFLSDYTDGAAFSAISAISFYGVNLNCPLIIDLADIYFESDSKPDFSGEFSSCSFIGYSFKSQSPLYSYFKTANNEIIETLEKNVISENASAGVYAYKNASLFLEGFSEILKNPKPFLYKDMLFVAPLTNGLTKNGKKGKIIKVHKHFDYKVSSES